MKCNYSKENECFLHSTVTSKKDVILFPFRNLAICFRNKFFPLTATIFYFQKTGSARIKIKTNVTH